MSLDEHVMNAIKNSIDFIEDSLKKEIKISDVADSASYSLYHFCRLFNRYVHHGPYDYIVRRRLTEAAIELKNTERHIIDIAFDYRFNSHETFSRAFKRFMDMRPNEWRKKGIYDRRLIFSRRTKNHLEFINKGLRAKPELIQNREMLFIGLSSFIEPTPDDVQSVWSIFEKSVSLIHDIVTPTKFYGINTYVDNGKKKHIHYMAAVEVKKMGDIHPALTAKRIPFGTYVACNITGPCKPARDYLYQTYLSKSGKRPTYPIDIECIGHNWQNLKEEDVARTLLIPISKSERDMHQAGE